jgi:hypothetical protein
MHVDHDANHSSSCRAAERTDAKDTSLRQALAAETALAVDQPIELLFGERHHRQTELAEHY